MALDYPVHWTHDGEDGRCSFVVKTTYQRTHAPSQAMSEAVVFTMSKVDALILINYWNRCSEDWKYTIISQELA